MMLHMRTTLTLDDDLAGVIQEKARQQGDPFKTVVNELLRAGLAATGSASFQRPPVRVIAKPLGLKTGYDPDKMNQLADELEVEEYRRKQSKG
jgi:hypothetical protein